MPVTTIKALLAVAAQIKQASITAAAESAAHVATAAANAPKGK